jgi:hypothetical protein
MTAIIMTFSISALRIKTCNDTHLRTLCNITLIIMTLSLMTLIKITQGLMILSITITKQH